MTLFYFITQTMLTIMFFKDLKPGFSIFIYDQSTIVVKSAKVVNVSTPHLDSNIQRTPIGSSPMSMVVDLTIDQDGVNKTYTISDTSETAYAGSVVISTERANILREVEATKTKFEQHLSQVPDIKAGLTKCNDILVEFNPAYKEKKETEERFSNIENNVNDLKGMMSEILRELKGTK